MKNELKILPAILFAFVAFNCNKSEQKKNPPVQNSKVGSGQINFIFLNENTHSESLPKSTIPRYQLIDMGKNDSALVNFIKQINSILDSDKPEDVLSLFLTSCEQCMSLEKLRLVFDLNSDPSNYQKMKLFFKKNMSSGGIFGNGFGTCFDTLYILPGIHYLVGNNLTSMCTAEDEASPIDCGVVAEDGSELLDTLSKLPMKNSHLMGSEVVVAIDENTALDSNWRKIKRFNGQEGFVPKSKIKSILDGKIIFTKHAGEWKICGVEGSNLKMGSDQEDPSD